LHDTEATQDMTGTLATATETIGAAASANATSVEFLQEATIQCVSVEASLPQGFLADGMLILADYSKDQDNGSLVAITSEAVKPRYLEDVPAASGLGYTSPGRIWMEYITYEQYGIRNVVISWDGHLQAVIPIDNRELDSQWLGDDHFVFIQRDIEGGPIENGKIRIWNHITRQQMVVFPNLPDFHAGYPKERWYVIYGPKLERVIYQQEAGEQGISLVLWDLENEQELWRLEKITVSDTVPKWSPDGARFAAVVMNQSEDNFDRFELYIVSRDGQASKWIDIKGYFPCALGVKIEWSPDGRYLAIISYSGQSTMLILDTKTRQLKDYCISGDAQRSHVHWSPDSTQVIVPQWDPPEIVLDLDKGVAAELFENYNLRPLGWLKSFPTP
jgi:WD40 repeat protein